MTFFPKKPIIAGVDLTSTSTKVALLRKKGASWEVLRLEEIARTVNPLDILPKDAILITALPSHEVMVRPLELPLKKEKDIFAAYEFQAEPLLPYPLEKGVVQASILETHAEGSFLTIGAVKKDHLAKHLQIAKDNHFEPEGVTSHPFALAALSSTFSEPEKPRLFMYVGEKEGTLTLVQKGKLIASRAFENEKFEIKKSVAALLALPQAKEIDSLLLLAEDPYLAQDMQEIVGKTVVIPQTSLTSDANLQKYALAIGIALAGGEKESVNFRQKEFAFPDRWKRFRKPLMVYFGLAGLLFFSLLAIEKNTLKRYEKKILDKAYLLAPSQTQEELFSKLLTLEKESEKTPQTFPLYPQFPRVSDLLAWLSTDPKCTPLEIEGLSYIMTNRPTFDRKQEKYQIKCELKFATPSVADAEALHTFLQHSAPFVDAKKEIEWIAGKGKYRVTFYLKDKTRYL